MAVRKFPVTKWGTATVTEKGVLTGKDADCHQAALTVGVGLGSDRIWSGTEAYKRI